MSLTQPDPRRLLERVLMSPRFRDSREMSELLLYICYQTQSGNLDALHEHDIGVAVLGLEPGYGTSEQPVVAEYVEQIRAGLKEYFAREGRREPLRVAIPKGEFRAFFYETDPRQLAEAEEPTALERFWGPYWDPAARNLLIHGEAADGLIPVGEAYVLVQVAALFRSRDASVELASAAAHRLTDLRGVNLILTGLAAMNPFVERFAMPAHQPAVQRIWRTDENGVITILSADSAAGLMEAGRFVTEEGHLERAAARWEQASFPPSFRLTIGSAEERSAP